ncbi:MAG: protein kinase domain-containing protein [Myxococcota bacterium]
MSRTDQFGKYTLLRHLATGGMAEIWLAEQQGPGGFAKELVIKRILPQLADDEQFIEMFLDEARLVAQLSHPNIAQIYELGQEDREYYIAMEYIRGMDLAELLERCKRQRGFVPAETAVRIILGALQGLEFAHEATDRDGMALGIIHRDVSPHNIFVSNEGVPKLLDFGVAKAASQKSKTQTGAVKGKYAYMAPEQVQSEAIDRRVDVFAAGVVLYELLTGEKPFGEELAAVSNILNEPHTDPREYRTNIPEQLVAVIDRALAKDKADRYQTADLMVRDLEAFLQSRPNYVGPRELAAFVRRLQGLPTPRVAGNGTFIEKVEDVDAARAEAKAEAERARREREQQHESQSQSQVRGPSTLREAEVGGGDTGPSRAVILSIIGLLTVVVLAAGVAAWVFVSGNVEEASKPPATEEKQAKTEAPKPAEEERRGAPSFVDPSKPSKTVFIDTKPRSKVYIEGEKLGLTPLDTSLNPGTYEVEFRTTGRNARRTIEVKASGSLVQRFKFEL